MGKTEKGAVWLDAEKTSPYEFYQYWRNVGDKDVEKCLALLTFLPMDEVRRLGLLEGSEINTAKEILAFELTKIVHGEENAAQAQQAARALFGNGGDGGSVPETEISNSDFGDGMDILSLLTASGLCSSRAEGRRLIQQGGLKMNDVKVENFDMTVSKNEFKDGSIMLQKGKKTFQRIKIV